jgi:hypothetical protein
MGLVFGCAFVSFHVQVEGLIGERGILPAVRRMEALEARGFGFFDVPTLAWWVGAGNGALHALCVAGELASLLLLLGIVPGAAALAAALFYLSLLTISGTFMALQWDILLVEAGVLAALMLPWCPVDRPSELREPPPLARWALYLLVFRLIFLSGVVKLASGDPAWASLAALEYHYWTQPLPGPLSYFVHQLPAALHRACTAATLAIELVLPFAIFAWAPGRRIAFAGTALLMIAIALTGNYGFFNLLTIVLALPLLDDAAIERVLPKRARALLRPTAIAPRGLERIRRPLAAVLASVLIALGALQLVMSLGGGRHLPDAAVSALDVARRFHVVNGYGLFAVMTRVRREIRIEGSLDGRTWREYRFRYKPGDPRELPGISVPHMPRLDWMMWFAALGSWRDSPWLAPFMQRLLDAEPDVLALLAEDPFGGARPRFVRAYLYDYRFSDFTRFREEGVYWRVEKLGSFGPTFRR